MLRSLTIRDLVLVEHLNIDFHGGLTVLSGETGAGKSVLIEAICLSLGKRADSGLVRQGAEKAEITAVFDIKKNNQIEALLEKHALSSDYCMLRRVIYKDGPSRAFCNDTPVTTGFLKSLSVFLADIHAQQQSQLLIEPYFQRNVLDLYADAIELRKEINEYVEEWKVLNGKLNSLNEKEDNNRLELIEYQLSELEAANLQPTEIETIEEQHRKLASLDHNLILYRHVKELLTSEHNGAGTSIQTACNDLEKIKTEENTNLKITLREISELIKEAVREVDRAEDLMQADPELLHRIEERLSALHEFARKHDCAIKELGQIIQKLEDEKSEILSQKEDVSLIETKITKVEAEFLERAQILSKKRANAAKKLALEVSNRLAKLGIPDAKFQITVEPRQEIRPTNNGADVVGFLLATNPNQEPSSLAKVASGGELSRTGLAVQAAVSSQFNIPTLIYDEVDSGIGGTTAAMVGRNLLKVSENCQVICITHSPQVACAGDHHYAIRKKIEKNKATVAVDCLGRKAKEAEIARMLGIPVPEGLGLEHARELIKSSSRNTQKVTRSF